jgi:hypothetical protein
VSEIAELPLFISPGSAGLKKIPALQSLFLSTCGKDSNFRESSSYTADRFFVFGKCLFLMTREFPFSEVDFLFPEGSLLRRK